MCRPSAPFTRWSFSRPGTAIQASLVRRIRVRGAVDDIDAAQRDGTLVADHATGECDEDLCQERHAWPCTPSGDSMPPQTNPLRNWQYFPGELSFLTVPASPCQIVEYGLSALGMTAVSYVIQGMSGRGSRGTGYRNHELEITTTKSRHVLGFCAICTAVAFVSVSADAQNAELDLELLHAAF